MLRELAALLARTDFSAPALDAALRGFAEATGRKLGQVAQPLRAALTGSTASPGSMRSRSVGAGGGAGADRGGGGRRAALADRP